MQLSQLNLQLTFAGLCALREDIENQRCAIEDLAIELLLEISALGGGEFVIEDDRVNLLFAASSREFLDLALPQISSCNGGVKFLDPQIDDFTACCRSEFCEFVERISDFPGRARF